MFFKQVFLHIAVQAIAWMAGTAAFAQQPYTITGALGKDRQGMVRLIRYTGEGQRVQDSAQVKDGVFELKGKMSEPGTAQLSLNFDEHHAMTADYFKQLDQQLIYLEGADYLVKSDEGFKTAVITGGKAQTEYTLLKELHKPLEEQMKGILEMVEKYKASGNDSGMQHLKEMASPIAKKGNAIDSAFIADHPDSYIAFDLWRKNIRGSIVPSIVEPQFLRFSERVRSVKEGRKLAAKIAKAKKLEVGQQAGGFILKDTLGQTVALSALKGKYVLISFWQKNGYGIASQRFSMSRVNRLYKDKGLQILAATSDENPDYIDNPQCLLVGPDGKILATRLQLNNELPSAIARFISPGGAASDGDVYVGGEMMKYPQVDWIQGTPIEAFEKDKIYIVELWATWCVPCVAAMPHLNELSRKFSGKITVIGQDVMEENREKVEKFVKGRGDGLTYRIAYAGGRGSDFDKKWIEPAGVTGIPQTFIIQNNKLVWQTHPDKLNEAVLQLLVDKKFTIDAAEALAEKN